MLSGVTSSHTVIDDLSKGSMSKTLMLHLLTSLRFSNQLVSSIQSKPENDQIRVSAEKKFHLLESYRSSEIGSCVTKGQCWLRNQFSF